MFSWRSTQRSTSSSTAWSVASSGSCLCVIAVAVPQHLRLRPHRQCRTAAAAGGATGACGAGADGGADVTVGGNQTLMRGHEARRRRPTAASNGHGPTLVLQSIFHRHNSSPYHLHLSSSSSRQWRCDTWLSWWMCQRREVTFTHRHSSHNS